MKILKNITVIHIRVPIPCTDNFYFYKSDPGQILIYLLQLNFI